MRKDDLLVVKMTDRKASGIKTMHVLDTEGVAGSTERQTSVEEASFSR